MGKAKNGPWIAAMTPMPTVRTHTFSGKKFRIMHGRINGAIGGCTSRRVKQPTIVIDERLKDLPLVEVAIHEAIHACFGDKLSEREVTRAGKDVSKFAARIMRQWMDAEIADPDSKYVERVKR